MGGGKLTSDLTNPCKGCSYLGNPVHPVKIAGRPNYQALHDNTEDREGNICGFRPDGTVRSKDLSKMNEDGPLQRPDRPPKPTLPTVC